MDLSPKYIRKFKRIYSLVGSLMVFCLLANTSNAWGASFHRKAPNTLVIKGEIVERDYERMLSMTPEGDNRLQWVELDSEGGNAHEALRMGMLIYNRDLNTKVVGECYSSCANYLFTAGKERVLEGVIGFHGNIRSSWMQQQDDIRESMAIAGRKHGASEDAIEKQWDLFEQRVLEDIPLETRFFGRLGISQSLFERSQIMKKDSLTIDFYIPFGVEELDEFGIVGIEGQQNLKAIKSTESYTVVLPE